MTASVPEPTGGRRARLLVGLALVAAAIGIPLWGSTLLVFRATEIAVFAVAFTGLHVLSGRLGLISVGHGAFVGIGALVAAHAIDDLSLPYLSAPLAGAAAGALFGLAIGIPSLRLPGAYLALLTLAMAMVLPIAVRQVDGPLGYRIDGDIRPPSWTGLGPAETDVWQYLLVIGVGGAIVGTTWLATRGRFTRALIAAREGPVAAAAFGIDVSRVRLIGVALSAALAGAAGGLRLYSSPLVAGSQYPFQLSVSMFALMVALGASRLATALPAAVILVVLPPVLVSLGLVVWEPIVYAALLLVMTRVSRGHGLASLVDRWFSAPGGSSRDPALGRGVERVDGGNPFLLTPEPPPRAGS